MKILESHPHWQKVQECCQKLHVKGFKAWLAGGCVRDALMNRTANDFDIATDATPDQVQEIFDKSIDVGAAFGVIVIPFDGFQVEIATFRKDGEYQDGRRPENIEFSAPEEDGQRRDFTVNAMFWDVINKELHDWHSGQEDLQNKILRTVGEPSQRFAEDHLRVLRAVRFSAQLGFEIESETYKAVCEWAEKVKSVSVERVQTELHKICISQDPVRGLQLLEFSGILAVFFGEDFYQDNWTEVKKRFAGLRSQLSEGFYWSVLLSGAWEWNGLKKTKDLNQVKTNIQKFLDGFLPNWKLAKKDMQTIKYNFLFSQLIEARDDFRLAEIKILLAQDEAPDAMKFYQLFRPQDQQGLLEFMSFYDIKDLPHAIPDPLVTGNDLQAWGVAKGPELGRKLYATYCEQIEQGWTSQKEAKNWLDSQNS